MVYISADNGTKIVKAARLSIESMLSSGKEKEAQLGKALADELFDYKAGIFVSLLHYHTNSLRGCMGFINQEELRFGVVESARAAAFGDQRFIPTDLKEWRDIFVEVNVIGEQIQMPNTKTGREKSIRIGRDGIILEYGIYRGVLLPSVAVENRMDAAQFMEAVCEKAGLNKNYWKQKNVHMKKFETQIFKEESPNGKVIEVIHGKGP